MTVPSATDVQYSTLADALQSELDALSKLPHEITLCSGTQLGSFAGRFYYRFEIPEHIVFRILHKARVSVGATQPISLNVDIVALENQYLTLAFPLDFGHIIPEARCSWDFTPQMKPIIDSLRSKSLPSTVTSLLLRPSDPANLHSMGFEPHVLPSTPPDQLSAVKKIFQNRVSYVWGPILSGKTHLLAHIAANYVKAGKKILFVATVNERVDDVLLRSIDIGQQLGIDMTMATCSLGLPAVENFEKLGDISFERQVELVKAGKRNSFQERVALLEKYWHTRIKQVLHADHYEKVSEMRERLSARKKQIDQLMVELAPLKETINRIQNASMMDKFKKGFGKEELASAQKKLEEKQSGLKRLQSSLTAMTQEDLRLEATNPITGEEQREYNLALKRVEELGGLAKVEEAVYQYTGVNERALLDQKLFIGTTLVSALSDERLKDMQFDMVMVDDAESIPIPYLVALSRCARDKMLVSGDPYQLEPESVAASELAQQWLQHDIFLHIARSDQLPRLFDFSEQNAQWCILLSSHFATTPKLSLFIGSILFDEKITVFASPKAKGHVFVVDTSHLRSQAKQYAGRKKILPANELHGKKMLELVKHALMEPGRKATDVGVMFPFQGPTLLAKQQLRTSGIWNVEVGTPQTFRGRRKKAIIVDTVMAGADYTMRPIDDKKVGEAQIVRLLNTMFSCVEEDLYLLADMNHFRTLYKDRLISKLLMLLKAQSDSNANFTVSAKNFDEMEWDKRAMLMAYLQEGGEKMSPEPARRAATKEDVELALQMKLLAKKEAKPEAPGRNIEHETYLAVQRILGHIADVNLLAQFAGSEILFRHNYSTEQAIAKLPVSACFSERDFRAIMDQWNLLIYEMSGGSKPEISYFKQAPETKVRWDINALKVFYSTDLEAVVEEGKQKLAVAVSRIFQECLGKPQPGNPAEWSTGYLNFLAKMESYFSWISEQLRK